MKKILVGIFLLFISCATFSMNPVCRSRHNGFLGTWFNDVHYMGSALNGDIPCISCSGHGPLRCILSNAGLAAPPDMDLTDERMMGEMFDYVDQQVESRDLEGSYQVLVQVEGETFKRVYNVTWLLGDKGQGDDRFWREDVEN